MNRKNLERGFSFGLYTSQSIYLEKAYEKALKIFYKSIDKKISILYTNFTKKHETKARKETKNEGENNQ